MKTLFAIIILSAFACVPVKATPPEPPAKMDATSAAQLDAAMAHLKELATQEQGFIKTIQAVCAQYKIDPQQIGRTVAIDFTTGNITRAPAPTQSAGNLKPSEALKQQDAAAKEAKQNK